MITVGIPAKKAAGTLDKVLAAVSIQQPAQIIVFNDGRDPVIERITKSFGAIYLFSETTLGIGAARNRILEQVKTDFVCFFDADACPAPQTLALLERAIFSKNADAACGRSEEDPGSSDAAKWRARSAMQSFGPIPNDQTKSLLGLCMMFKTDVLREAGGFDETFAEAGEDQEIALRLASMRKKIAYVPSAKVFHMAKGAFSDVLKQAFRHAKGQAEALKKHSVSLLPSWKSAARDLTLAGLDDLHAFDIKGAVFAACILAARTLGFLAGKLKK